MSKSEFTIPNFKRPAERAVAHPSSHPYANTNVAPAIVAREIARGELVSDDFGYWVPPSRKRGATLPIEIPSGVSIVTVDMDPNIDLSTGSRMSKRGRAA